MQEDNRFSKPHKLKNSGSIRFVVVFAPDWASSRRRMTAANVAYLPEVTRRFGRIA